MVATWSYDTENTDCIICNKNLMMPVGKDNNQMSSDVIIGPCKHGFHTICIQEIIKLKNNCPMCSIEWSTCSNVGSSVYIYNSTN